MTAENHKTKNDAQGKKRTTHDFFKDRSWITFWSGFSDNNSIAYQIYRAFIYCTFIEYISMAVVACVLKPEKQVIVYAVHHCFCQVYGIWNFTARLVNKKEIKATSDILISGIYIYEDEEEDQELMKIKESIPDEINYKFNLFIPFYVAGGLFNVFLFPIFQMLLLDPSVAEDADVINPYFSAMFYQPFDSNTVLGLMGFFVVGCFYIYALYWVTIGMTYLYVSYAIQVQLHFKILNHSIKTIQERAFRMYKKYRNITNLTDETVNGLLGTEEFQQCLYRCFTCNVQHHQCLLRLLHSFEPYLGSILLDVFSIASTVLGAILYLINEGPPLNLMISFIMYLLAEQISVVYLCKLGEDVISESEKVFHQLYTISWYKYGRKFNQALQTMMSQTITPMCFKATLLGVPASLKTYGDLNSAMYKVSNLVRQSDVA